MWGSNYRKVDEESGSSLLYPMMLESPELRWSFIRKIYTIVSIQLLLTIAVASVVVIYHPISLFFTTTNAVLCPLQYYYQKHPVNYILLGIFTVALAFAVGLTCAYTSGKVILEAVILTAAVCQSHLIHILGCKARSRFQFPGTFLVWCPCRSNAVCIDSDFIPYGKDKRNDIWMLGINHILWLHRL